MIADRGSDTFATCECKSGVALFVCSRPCVDNFRFSMATTIGPLAVVAGEPRQARKGAAAAGDPGAGVRLIRVASQFSVFP